MKTKVAIKIFTILLGCFLLSPTTLFAKTKIFVDSDLSTTEIIDTLSELARQHIEKEQYDITLEYLERALDLSIETPQKYRYFEILVDFGRTYFLTNNYSLSQKYAFRLLEENDENSNLELVSDALSILSSSYNSLGDINAAHEYRLKSIEIDKILGDTISIIGSYYNLGTLFYYQDVSEKALDYYQKSKELSDLINNPRLIYNSIAAIGSVYGKMGQIEKALELNTESLRIADSLDYLTGQAYSLGNIGSNYIALKEYSKAKIYVERSLKLKEEVKDKWGLIGAHLTMSQLYDKTNNFELAEKSIFAALEIAKEIKARKRVADVYKDISQLYSSVNRNDLAIEYLNKHMSVKDSIMNEDILREMSNSKVDFAKREKQHEIDLLESNKKAQNYKLIAIGALAIFFLIVSIIFRSLLTRQKKLSRLLEEKNTEIETQKNKIQIQNKELESSNEDLKRFAYVASHDLREPLRMVTSYGKLLTRRYKDKLDEEGQEFLFFMTDAASRMDELLLDLLKYAKTSSNAEPFEKVATAELAQSVSRIMERALSDKNASLEINIENLPVIEGRKTQLQQLFQNFISNGLKYNLSKKPQIKIDCVSNEKEHVFSFTDNGLGIPKEHQAKIFEMFQRLHGKGKFEGTGIGLATCKKIADIHNGRITVQSKEGLGSTFYLHIPR
jgi:signal transduction histidine kinase